MPVAITEPTQPTAVARTAEGCFHCGEPCPDAAFVLDGKSFCCFGCQTVFSLLRENGLEQFYQLQSAPGTRVRKEVIASKWSFLDDPAVAERLFDYADKTIAKVTLHLPAIHCVACVWLLENLFRLHPGVGRVLVNFPRREAAITFTPGNLKFSELAALLASLGYEPWLTLGETEKPKKSPPSKKTWLQIGIAAFGFGNIMLMSLPLYLGLDSFNGPWFRALAGWLGLAMTLPVVTFSASDFWLTAWISVRQRVLTMEVPIALGLAAIYLSSVWEVVMQRGPGYCDSLCGLIFFLLCGRLFQKKTYDRLTFDRDYKGFFPLSVVRIAEAFDPPTAVGACGLTCSAGESVSISRLRVGDRIILRNGELLPADAKMLKGEACLDYSFVTGESEPVAHPPGSHLYAGGRQVGGAIEVEIIKPVAQSYLATLWDNEAFRKNRDNGLDSLTNRYSRHFTKLVIGVALASAVYWMMSDASVALKAATSVLIVACPCALALAAPLTHGTAQRVLNRIKIFLKNALVIERMAAVDTIVFDKTGTLTTADARGIEFVSTASGGARPAMLSKWESSMVASLARHSTHPNSARIAKALGGAVLTVSNFNEIFGFGVEGMVEGRQIRLGSRAWIGGLACEETGAKGSSSVFVSIDGKARGVFALENSLRPEVEKLIAQLGGRFELALLSGDNEREEARFQKIFGEKATLRFHQSPTGKLDFIRELQQQGRRVMMVGDGLNDAGALQQADVGVAVVEQVGVFSPASDVILDAAELPRLARVLDFSHKATRVVRLGFIISAIYNVFGVSIAAAGLLSPIVCAILMPLSSATVVLFSCGTTVWLGRQLMVNSPATIAASGQPSTMDYRLSTKEAA